MSKKLRKEPINIAPEIIGWLDEYYEPIVFDNRKDKALDPRNVYDKIEIYERQVMDWFLIPAKNLSKYNNKNKGFVVLMICLSYLEGVEQYRQGELSHGNSKRFFVSAMQKLFPKEFTDYQLKEFYSQARCGLFHNGMVSGKIIINNKFSETISFEGNDIKINTSKFIKDIIKDFNGFIQELKSNTEMRNKFDKMYSNI